MAKTFLISIIFLLFLTGICFPQSPMTTCDFSRYKYFWMDHFLPLGLLSQGRPIYPNAAKAVGASGLVQIDIIVDSRGKVREACATNGNPLLRAAAVKAARETKFKPNFGLTNPQSRRLKFIKSELFFRFILPD